MRAARLAGMKSAKRLKKWAEGTAVTRSRMRRLRARDTRTSRRASSLWRAERKGGTIP